MKFWLGDEHSGLKQDVVDWITQTFDAGSYRFVDEGYFTYDRYVVFNEEKDAAMFRLRWS